MARLTIVPGARVRHILSETEGRVIRTWEGDAATGALPRAEVEWTDGRTETHIFGELEALPAWTAPDKP